MADDHQGDTTTLGVLTPGVVVAGALETAGDRDWFAVDLVEDVEYVVRLRSDLFAAATAEWPILDIHDSDGSLIDSTDTYGRVTGRTRLDLFPEETARYFVSVRSGTDDTGRYVVDLLDFARDSIATRNDPFAMDVGSAVAGDVADGGSAGAPRNGYDDDWFAIDLTAGVTYWIEGDGRAIPFSGVDGMQLYLHDTNGTEVVASLLQDKSGSHGGLTFTATETGRYLIAVDPVESGGFYELSVAEAVTLTGTGGGDWLSAPDGYDARLMAADGGAGQDVLSFADFQPNGLTINLETGLIRSEVRKVFDLLATGIEGVTGTRYGDTVYGSAGADRVRGLGDADTIYGSAGADRIDGGSGRDTLDFLFGTTGVSASLLRGRGWAGDAAGDHVAGIENIAGTHAGDTLWGDHGANRIDGRHGDDTLTGLGGDDYILAGFGHDVIVFSGDRADYTITTSGFRTVVTDTLGRDGTDTLAHAEVLRFSNGDFVL